MMYILFALKPALSTRSCEQEYTVALLSCCYIHSVYCYAVVACDIGT